MKLKLALGILVLLALGATGFYVKDSAEKLLGSYFKPAGDEPVPTIKAVERPYVLAVAADGELTGLEMKAVNVPRVPRGSLKISWMEKEGTMVEEGQPLVRFDNADAVLTLQQNQNTKASYESRIGKTEEDARSQGEVQKMDMHTAVLDLNFAERQIRQDEDIFSRWEIEESVMSAALAKYKKGNIERKTVLNRSLSDADLRILNIESRKADSEVKLAEQTLSSLEVTSPALGVVLYRRMGFRPIEVGSEVWPGLTLMDIADVEKFQGKLNVLEADIAGVEPGKKVTVRLAAFPEIPVTGTVRKVATAAQQFSTDDPRKFFVCEVLLDVATDMMDRLKPGMKINGEIEIGRRDKAIVLPKSAVIKKSSEFTVFVKTPTSYGERKVKILDGDYGFYLLDGVRPGEEVCLQHPFEKQKLHLPDFSAPTAATQSRRFTVIF